MARVLPVPVRPPETGPERLPRSKQNGLRGRHGTEAGLETEPARGWGRPGSKPKPFAGRGWEKERRGSRVHGNLPAPPLQSKTDLRIPHRGGMRVPTTPGTGRGSLRRSRREICAVGIGMPRVARGAPRREGAAAPRRSPRTGRAFRDGGQGKGRASESVGGRPSQTVPVDSFGERHSDKHTARKLAKRAAVLRRRWQPTSWKKLRCRRGLRGQRPSI